MTLLKWIIKHIRFWTIESFMQTGVHPTAKFDPTILVIKMKIISITNMSFDTF